MTSILASKKSSLFILFYISFVYFLENFDRYLISVSPIPYIDYSSYEYSILAGPAFTLVYTLGGLLFSLYYNSSNKTVYYFSEYNILALTTIIFSLAFAATAFAINFWQQVIIRIVMGISQSLVTPFSTSIISKHFESTIRGTALGIFNAGTYFAFSFSLSLGTFVYIMFGWRAGYILFGLLGMLCGILMPLLGCFKSKQNNDSVSSEVIESNGNNNNNNTNNNSNEDITENLLTSFGGNYPEDSDSSYNTHISTTNGNNSMFTTIYIMSKTLYEISWKHWGNCPGVYMLCLATGIRLGAGYIWSAYTSVFFSDLFVIEENSSCDYSYNSTTTYSDSHYKNAVSYTSRSLSSDECSSDYPYCRDGSCYDINTYPWHNKGLDPVHLEVFMSWVPIVGSAFGSLLGGLLADYVIRRQKIFQEQNSSNDLKAAEVVLEEDCFDSDNRSSTVMDETPVSPSNISNSSVDGNSDTHTTSATYKIDREFSYESLGGGKDSFKMSPNSRFALDRVDKKVLKSKSASKDNVVYNLINNNNMIKEEELSDSNNNTRSSSKEVAPDESFRMLIAGVSNLVAMPLATLALFLDYPYCFIIFIPSGMIGEMYLGQALALLTDKRVIPPGLITPSIALFMFIVTLIGGNIPILVPLFAKSVVGYTADVTIQFEAESTYTGSQADAETVDFRVSNDNAKQLQYSMLYLLGFCYVVSGVLYIIAYYQMRNDYINNDKNTN